eukprot:CAMPEP_0168528810 /NCGR_PEP_ID=MMETSP0405-20121227/13488_1 /TAXON_ID=498012 /ORGANISM="Trichosphaerium sp, Strain Am-I-7 wt" /LENGTH=99 /DNA_ID=CAMNT_0008552321 /DNA_START=80 /DNA_END=379 /DNA_ORIENTATION=+
MAGVISIYGLIIAIIITTTLPNSETFDAFKAFSRLAAGLCVGIPGLAAGIAIGIIGDAGVRANAHQPRVFVSMILMLIFAEALALFGLIIAIIMATKAQ